MTCEALGTLMVSGRRASAVPDSTNAVTPRAAINAGRVIALRSSGTFGTPPRKTLRGRRARILISYWMKYESGAFMMTVATLVRAASLAKLTLASTGSTPTCTSSFAALGSA